MKKNLKTILITIWLTIGTLGTIVAVLEAWLGTSIYTGLKDRQRARRRKFKKDLEDDCLYYQGDKKGRPSGRYPWGMGEENND